MESRQINDRPHGVTGGGQCDLGSGLVRHVHASIVKWRSCRERQTKKQETQTELNLRGDEPSSSATVLYASGIITYRSVRCFVCEVGMQMQSVSDVYSERR